MNHLFHIKNTGNLKEVLRSKDIDIICEFRFDDRPVNMDLGSKVKNGVYIPHDLLKIVILDIALD